MKLHPTTVLGLEPTEELGQAIMALRYDLIEPVLEGMLKEARRQRDADEAADRVKLAYRLDYVAGGIENTITALSEVQAICKDAIDAEKNAMTVPFRTETYIETEGERVQFDHEGTTYVAVAHLTGFAVGAHIDDAGKATLVYR